MKYIEYVIVYAYAREENAVYIPLVLKNKPDYLKGVLNLPGGKIEADETPIAAAIRELKEETGLQDLSCDTEAEQMGIIKDDDEGYVIYCCKVPLSCRKKLVPQEGETEPAYWFDIKDVINEPNLMPNLRLVIPFMTAGFKGWEIYSHPDWRYKSHFIDLKCNKDDRPITVIVPGTGEQ